MLDKVSTASYLECMRQDEYNAVPVGEGYRELGPDEVVEKGDEIELTDGLFAPARDGYGLGFFVRKVSIGHHGLKARFRRLAHG